MRHLVFNLYDDEVGDLVAAVSEIQEIIHLYDCTVSIYLSTARRFVIKMFEENPIVRVTRFERMPVDLPVLDIPQADAAVRQLMQTSYGYWVNSIGITRALVEGAKYQIAYTGTVSQLNLAGLESLIEQEVEANYVFLQGLTKTYPYYMLSGYGSFFSDPATSVKLSHLWSNVGFWNVRRFGWDFYNLRFKDYTKTDEQFGAYLWHAWCTNQAIKFRNAVEDPQKHAARVKGLFHGSYDGWRTTRIAKLIDLLGTKWFKGKKILELGAGHGHIGADLAKLGAKVTCAEGRIEHLEQIKQAYPNLRSIQLDQDTPWELNEQFDLVIHWGVLYHLDKWQEDLKSALAHAPIVSLETEVVDSTDPTFQLKTREQGFDQAINRIGSRPSPGYIEAQLEQLGATFKRYDDPSLNHGVHRYDWISKDTGEWDFGQRRFWMVKR